MSEPIRSSCRRPFSRPGVRISAFTLIELLVATAVVALILVVLLSLTTSTMEVSQSSHGKMQSGGDLRSAFDRMSADFAAAILREDLPPYFLKNSGADDAEENDEFLFYTASEGYGDGSGNAPDRNISRVGYRVRDGKLERGVAGA